jgi:hypothetical protein
MSCQTDYSPLRCRAPKIVVELRCWLIARSASSTTGARRNGVSSAVLRVRMRHRQPRNRRNISQGVSNSMRLMPAGFCGSAIWHRISLRRSKAISLGASTYWPMSPRWSPAAGPLPPLQRPLTAHGPRRSIRFVCLHGEFRRMGGPGGDAKKTARIGPKRCNRAITFAAD